MVNKGWKKEFHWFLLTDYEQEEEFLREKHNAGERLAKVGRFGNYYFEACAPEDVVYRLDFNPQKKTDRESYLQMFRDYGWEHVQDLNEFSYFRKPAEESAADMAAVAGARNGNADEIFSDDASKLEMLKRIFRKRMLPILAILLLIVIPQFFLWMQDESRSIASGILLVMWIALFAAYLGIILHCGRGFARLHKKYTDKGI